MSDTKMLQTIINGQSAIKEELKNDIKKAKEELKKDVLRVEKKVDKNGERLDKQGKQLAYLEDDAPTIAASI